MKLNQTFTAPATREMYAEVAAGLATGKPWFVTCKDGPTYLIECRVLNLVAPAEIHMQVIRRTKKNPVVAISSKVTGQTMITPTFLGVITE